MNAVKSFALEAEQLARLTELVHKLVENWKSTGKSRSEEALKDTTVVVQGRRGIGYAEVPRATATGRAAPDVSKHLGRLITKSTNRNGKPGTFKNPKLEEEEAGRTSQLISAVKNGNTGPANKKKKR